MNNNQPEKFIPVSEVERRSRVSYNTLRYYTKLGLLPYMTRKHPYPKAPSTVGHYPESVLETLQKIRKLKKQKLNNNEIKEKFRRGELKAENQLQSPPPVAVEPSSAPREIPTSPPPKPPTIDLYHILAEEKKHSELLSQISHFLVNMIRAPLPAREPAWAKVFTHTLTLALVLGALAILSLGFSNLTHARIGRLFSSLWDQYIERIVSGEVLGIKRISSPIVGINDTLEYYDEEIVSGEERWLVSKFPLTVEGTTLGTETLLAGETTTLITNSLVTNYSRIFVTPKVPTTAPLAITQIEEGKSFTIEIAQSQEVDVPFNYWIVESQTLTQE